MRIVECVPNFSEGRDREKINAIVREIETTAGVKLLDVDPGESTNRTVVTFIGEPDGVQEAAFKAIKKAGELIDMRDHKGAHSRIGATDVCPFVPVSGVSMADCVRMARELGRRVASELGIPVYLYEEAAIKTGRKNLAEIRSGEYERLPEKIKDPYWAPDYGEPAFNPKSGATVIGAREFLIAYNINLNTRDRRLAHEIALNIRESGHAKKDKEGRIVRDRRGNIVKQPGKFKEVKAVGWYVEDYGVAQISINFTNTRVSPIHRVFDEVVRQAAKLGLRVTGSELVGLIPKEALLMSGRYYLEKQGKSPGVPDEELIRTAVLSLGLNDVSPFEPDKKIIEYQFKEPGKRLVESDLRSFANQVSMDSPTPGGGSVAALCGALSASLASMVANLTYGKKGYEESAEEMKTIAVRAQILKDELLHLVDLDAKAFNKVMDAYRLPKGTDEDLAKRATVLDSSSKEATLVPLRVLEASAELAGLASVVVRKGNTLSLSDAGVAGLAARAAGLGAYYNVRINLPNIKDRPFKSKTLKQAALLKDKLEKSVSLIEIRMAKQLSKP